MKSKKSKGVLYIATGDEFIQEAAKSAASLLKHNEINITLLSDRKTNHNVFDDNHIINSPLHNQGDSVISYSNLPYEKTLFLDTDTYVTSSIMEIFSALDRFDIACSFNIGMETTYADIISDDKKSMQRIPESFYEFNTGVLAMKKSDEMKHFLSEWEELYSRQSDFKRNQPAFRKALYESKLRILPLPRKYNYRLPKVAATHGQIKIIHGRHPSDYATIGECINAESGNRVISKSAWPLGVTTNSEHSIRYIARFLCNKYGLYESFQYILDKLRKYGLKGTIKKLRW